MINKWTLALAAAGLVSPALIHADEPDQHPLMTGLSSTTLSGYVDTSAIWSINSPNGTIAGRMMRREFISMVAARNSNY